MSGRQSLLALVAGLLAACAGAASAQAGAISLEVIAEIALPVSEVARASVGRSGELALQTPAGVYLWEGVEARQVRRVGAFDQLQIVGVAPSEGGLILVDARTSRWVTVDREGNLLRWAELPVVGPVEEAVLGCKQTWTLLVRPLDGQLRLHWVTEEGGEVGQHEIPFVHARLLASGEWITVTETDPPFRALAFRCLQARPAALEPPEADAGRTWYSLPTIMHRDRFIRVLVDQASDERRVLTYNLRGERLRTTALRAPLGLIGAWGDRYVFGLRRIDSLELLVYTDVATARR